MDFQFTVNKVFIFCTVSFKCSDFNYWNRESKLLEELSGMIFFLISFDQKFKRILSNPKRSFSINTIDEMSI